MLKVFFTSVLLLLWGASTDIIDLEVGVFSRNLLAAWGRPGIHWYFAATKPLDHQPFRQQVAERPIMSLEVTYGGSGRLWCFHSVQLWVPYFAVTSHFTQSYFEDYTSQLTY